MEIICRSGCGPKVEHCRPQRVKNNKLLESKPVKKDELLEAKKDKTQSQNPVSHILSPEQRVEIIAGILSEVFQRFLLIVQQFISWLMTDLCCDQNLFYLWKIYFCRSSEIKLNLKLRLTLELIKRTLIPVGNVELSTFDLPLLPMPTHKCKNKTRFYTACPADILL